MRNKSLILSVLLLSFFYSPLIYGETPSNTAPNPKEKTMTDQIEELTGAKGTLNEKEGVFKVTFPRSDLDVTASGVKITPPMGLTAWAAFKLMEEHTMVMGDLVLTEEQVNPVMDVALANSLEVTGLHNHFFWDSPKIMFMHISGSDNPQTLAYAIGKVFQKIKETESIKKNTAGLVLDPSKTSLDPNKIENVLGIKGEMNHGVYKVVIGRTTTMKGHEMGNMMGVNTWAAFVGSDDKAVVDGDFAMLESELQSVLKALRKAGINIVAIHNHMTMESPRIIFLHFWAEGSTANLAKGIKAALETQHLKAKV